MLGARKQSMFGAWRLPDYPQIVEYAQPVLDAILTAAADGFNSLSHGGVEVGGVLFGTGDKHLVRILATRPIGCEHASGPAFLLSDKDHQKLAALLRDYKSAPELAEMVPVGWYQSRTRSEFAITGSDRRFHDRYFRKPWQLALILRPDASDLTHAGIFVRGSGGELPAEPTLVVEERRAPAAAGIADKSDQVETLDSESAVASEPSEEARAEPVLFKTIGEHEEPGTGGQSRTWRRIAACVLLIGSITWAANQWLIPPEQRKAVGRYFTSGAAYWEAVKQYWTGPGEAPATSPFALRIAGSGERLTIMWDPAAEPLRTAPYALLQVQDGDQKTEFPLSPAALIQGSTTYQRQSNAVRISLIVPRPGQDALQETASFSGAAVSEAAAHEAAPAPETTTALRAEIDRLQAALRRQDRATDSPAETPASLGKTPPARPPAPPIQQPPARPPAPPKQQPPPPAPARSAVTLAQKAPTPSPPTAVVLEQRPPAAPATRSASPSARPAPGARASRTASSGRLIWTGFLAGNAVLKIGDGGPSSGNLSGRLPGTPVRVTAYPAELLSSGLTVFSANPKHSKGDVTEAPGSRNAWNRTTYRWAPERARAVEVLEAPGPQNDWSRLVLASVDRSLSVIVVEWERVQPGQ